MDTSEPRWWVRLHPHTEADKEKALVALHDFDIEAVLEGDAEEDTHFDVYFKTYAEFLRFGELMRPDIREKRRRLAAKRSPPGAGEVFGQHFHFTTELILQWMPEVVQVGDIVADIGSGTGKLAAAADCAQLVIATDIDWPAVQATRATLSNRSNSRVIQGSAAALASASFDLILANLHLALWRSLAPEIARIAKPQSQLIASGFLEEQIAEVETLLRLHGWSLMEARTADGWLAVRAMCFA